ncbi:TIGR02594 family protein [Roseateles sp. NT4]|uniref:TIGR02594 family protein n=1 Tax=Roseateles sp. NT4 TaxID=3453715 RepID=UPI003EF00664
MTALQNYRVQNGDTLTGIAHRLGISPEALMRANHMDVAQADGRMGRGSHDPDKLQVGQQLVIPVATPGLEREHHVVAGETLAGIADRWGISVKELLAANPQFDAGKLGAHAGHGRGQDPDLLHVGDLIHRPTHAATPAPAGTGEAAVRSGLRTAQGAAIQQAAAPLAGQRAPSLDLQRFTDPALGSNAPAAIVIGSAEGTRRPDGSFTAAYGGHTDPGNAAHNRGSFSYQHAATSATDADSRQLQKLSGQLPAYEAAARRAGLDPNNARLASAYLDLFNQSESAAGRFLDQLGTLRGQPIDTAHLTQLRVNSFVDASTGERFPLQRGGLAGSGFATIAQNQLHGRTPTEAQVQAVIRADQLRRSNALEAALQRQGLLAPAVATAAPAAAPNAGIPRHLQIARAEIGTHEIAGSGDNPRIVEYHQATTLKARDDETSWCSSFVNWTMQQAGVQGTRSAAARSWLNWGQAVPRDAQHVKPGDVIVFPRGNNPAQGHVAIVSEVLDGGRVRVVGGNQRGEVLADGTRPDAVTESVRRLSDAIGVRRAP